MQLFLLLPLVEYRNVEDPENRLSKHTIKRVESFYNIVKKIVGSDIDYYSANKKWVDYCLGKIKKRLGYNYLSELKLLDARKAFVDSLSYYRKDYSVYILLLSSYLPASLLTLLGKIKRSL